MVMAIQDEINSLEAELAKVSGPGSKAKKKELQDKINKLKAEAKETKSESERHIASPPISEEPKTDNKSKAIKASVANSQPLPTNWVKVTMEEVQTAEKAGKLVGFDAQNMLALIRE